MSSLPLFAAGLAENKFAASGLDRIEAASFPEFINKLQEVSTSHEKGRRLICATMRDGHRCEASAEPRSWLGVDIDNVTPAQFMDYMGRATAGGYQFAWYPTSSSTPERPKFRLIVPIDAPVSRENHERLAQAWHQMVSPADMHRDYTADRIEQPLYLPIRGEKLRIVNPGGRSIPAMLPELMGIGSVDEIRNARRSRATKELLAQRGGGENCDALNVLDPEMLISFEGFGEMTIREALECVPDDVRCTVPPTANARDSSGSFSCVWHITEGGTAFINDPAENLTMWPTDEWTASRRDQHLETLGFGQALPAGLSEPTPAQIAAQVQAAELSAPPSVPSEGLIWRIHDREAGQPRKRRMVIPDLIEAGIVTLAGERGKGKTTLLSGLIAHATGSIEVPGIKPCRDPWHVVVLAEDTDQYDTLLTAAGVPSDCVTLLHSRRLAPATMLLALAQLRQYLGDRERVWLIIDTMNANFSLENSNSDAEAGQLIDAIRQAGYPTLIVGHGTKDSANLGDLTKVTMRGSGAIEGDAQQCLVFGRDDEGTMTLLQTKGRGAARVTTDFTARKEMVSLWDEDNECEVVEPAWILDSIKGARKSSETRPAEEMGRPVSLFNKRSPFATGDRGRGWGFRHAERMLDTLKAHVGDQMVKHGLYETSEDALTQFFLNVECGIALKEKKQIVSKLISFVMNDENRYFHQPAVARGLWRLAPAFEIECAGKSTKQQLIDCDN